MKCITCQNELNNDKFYFVKEMMYGYRDEFKYYHCSKCGCLQINNIPEDLENTTLKIIILIQNRI